MGSRHEISPQFPGFGSASGRLAGQHYSARGPGPSLNLSVCVGQVGHHRSPRASEARTAPTAPTVECLRQYSSSQTETFESSHLTATETAQSSLKPPKSRLGLSKKKIEISRNSAGL